MLNGSYVVHVGNATDDFDLRFTPGGAAVGDFTLAVNSRENKGDGWEDREAPLYVRCTAWFDMAEHCAETITKGMRMIVVGDLYVRPWQDRDGNRRESVEMTVDAIGPDLRWAEAKVRKVADSSRDDRDDDRDDRRGGSRRGRDDRRGRDRDRDDDREDARSRGRGSRGGRGRDRDSGSRRDSRGSGRGSGGGGRGSSGRRDSAWDDDEEGDSRELDDNADPIERIESGDVDDPWGPAPPPRDRSEDDIEPPF